MKWSEMIRFLDYDHSPLNQTLKDFHFTRRDDHPTKGPLVPTPYPLPLLDIIKPNVYMASITGLRSSMFLFMENIKTI